MHPSRGVLFFALTLLAVQVLAEGVRETKELGSFSSELDAASGARLVRNHAENIAAKTARSFKSASSYDGDAAGAFEENMIYQDSSSRSENEALRNIGVRSQQNDASDKDYDYRAAYRAHDSHHKREVAGLTVTLAFTAASTNSTVSTAICSALNSSVTTLTITNSAGAAKFFQIPACVASAPLTRFDAEWMTTSSFNVFPNTLDTLYCRQCAFRYDSTGSSTPISSTPAAQTTDGFNSDGSISWTELFVTFPNLGAIDFFFGYLTATLPPSPPARLTFLRMRGIQYDFTVPTSGLTGALPATFFTNIAAAGTSSSYFFMDVSYNRMTGSIPSTWFSSFAGQSFGTIDMILYGSNLNGALASGLFTPLASAGMGRFEIQLGNGINGSLPAFPSGMLRTGSTFTFNAGSAALTGSIPEGFLSAATLGSYVNLDLSGNQLTGPLPSAIFAPGVLPSGLTLNLYNNLINGSLTSFISSGFTSNLTLTYCAIRLDGNLLTGSIPETLLFNYVSAKRDSSDANGDGKDESEIDSELSALTRSSRAATAMVPVGMLASTQFVLSLAGNRLTGTVPAKLLAASFLPATDILYGVTVDLSGNLLEGPFPSDFYDSLSNSISGTFYTSINNNLFSGTIPTFCRATTSLANFDMSNNNVTGPIPTEWQSCKLKQVLLNNNPYLGGSIPPNLLNTTGILSFAAKNTSLTGYLPPLAHDVRPDYSQSCTLQSSDACNCGSSYIQCGSSITCPPPGFLPPYEAPFVYVEPVTPPFEPIDPVTPSSTPTQPTPPSNCPPPSTRPGPEFNCVNGFWTAPAVMTPTLSIPSGAGKVIVNGNMESDEVIIRDLSSDVEVSGCANSLTNINLQLTKEQAEEIGSGTVTKTLIVTSASGCNNLNSVNLNTQVSNQGCKKLKSSKQVSPDGTTLTGVFSLQTSSCNTWWIILVAVVCGVILIAVIVIVILVTCCNCCKQKARPFAGSDGRYSV